MRDRSVEVVQVPRALEPLFISVWRATQNTFNPFNSIPRPGFCHLGRSKRLAGPRWDSDIRQSIHVGKSVRKAIRGTSDGSCWHGPGAGRRSRGQPISRPEGPIRSTCVAGTREREHENTRFLPRVRPPRGPTVRIHPTRSPSRGIGTPRRPPRLDRERLLPPSPSWRHDVRTGRPCSARESRSHAARLRW
jgi:hypothetical protein